MLYLILYRYGVYTIPSAEQNGKAQVYDGQWQESSMSGYGTLRYVISIHRLYIELTYHIHSK